MLGWLRLDLVRLLALGPPVVLAGWLLGDLAARYAAGRVVAALLLLPLLAAALLLAATLRPRRPRAFGWRYLVFFPVFCALFATAASTDLLTGERRLLAGYDEEVPRNFLALDRLGDWRYRLLPAGEPAEDLIVVTFPSFAGELRAEVRRRFAFLVRAARTHGARAVAFDYFLEAPSPIDSLLAGEIAAAEAAGTAVVLGYRQTEVDGRLERRPLAPAFAEAVPEARQGHLAGYLEADGVVRAVPLELPGEGQAVSLSYRLAELRLGAGPPLEEGRLLRFVRPRWGVPVVPFAPDAEWERLRGRTVLVGTDSETDRVETPFGQVQGVEIHAWAAHGLAGGRFLRKLDDRWMMPAVYLLCYLLTVAHARGAHGWRLVRVAGLLAVVVLATAVVALRGSLLWVEVSYPLAAIGALTGLFFAGAVVPRLAPGMAWAAASRAGEARPAVAGAAAVAAAVVTAPERTVAADEARPVATPAGDDAGERATSRSAGGDSAGGFDVFLSHNGRDKPVVRELTEALRLRGLSPWLDEEQLVPGRPWQEGLEAIIRTTRSAAVLVGPDGLGPWELPEMRACLSEAVRRGLPVIPVLLPGAGKRPDLPLFLTQYTWVDLRGGLDASGLDRLEWGVTGVKPAGRGRRAA